MTILSIIIGIIILLDVLTFLVKATGNASNFMWYLCRPLWGILGNGVYQNISMFIGLLIRLAEAVVLTHIVENLFRQLVACAKSPFQAGLPTRLGTLHQKKVPS